MAEEKCYICGAGEAQNICHNCGHHVCEECFESISQECILCKNHKYDFQGDELGFPHKLFLIGLAIMSLAMLLIIFTSSSMDGQISGGTIILIGPIPIILGWGPHSYTLLALALVLTIIGVLLFLMTKKR